MRLKPIPSEFKRRLNYCPKTGEFRWIDHPNHFSKNGKLVKSSVSTGYKKVYLRDEPFLQHRVAFYMMTDAQPWGDIDHINGDIRDNRWENLRLVTHAQNALNRKKHCGVAWHSTAHNWQAYYRSSYLGRTKDLFEAWCMRKRAELVNSQ